MREIPYELVEPVVECSSMPELLKRFVSWSCIPWIQLLRLLFAVDVGVPSPQPVTCAATHDVC